jgi:pyruvate dehydrogenase E2 component (dihydrolipoamide acetyltransferase)
MPEVPMPRLSDSMEEGTVLQWLKRVGDEVAAGEPLVEIETDKANMVYEADVAGALTEILVADGETAPVGSPIARIGEPAASAPAAAAEQAPVPSVPAPRPARDRRGPSASPVARRAADELGVELAAVSGSGPHGRILKADVEATAVAAPAARPQAATPAQAETAKGTATIVELSKLQQVVARRMSESKATAPHFYLEAEIDMTVAVEARQRLKRLAAADGPPPPTVNDMVVKACALALRRFPKANGSYREGRLELYSRVNVGVAVAAEDALVVPTIFDADGKGLREIAAESRRLAAAVKDGSITPPELAGGTFTVSNLGMFGVSSFAAVVNSPQAAILAVGALAPKPAAVGDRVEVRQLMRVTLSCDHRILYGAEGAQFLAAIRDTLQEPISLAL